MTDLNALIERLSGSEKEILRGFLRSGERDQQFQLENHEQHVLFNMALIDSVFNGDDCRWHVKLTALGMRTIAALSARTRTATGKSGAEKM